MYLLRVVNIKWGINLGFVYVWTYCLITNIRSCLIRTINGHHINVNRNNNNNINKITYIKYRNILHKN